MISRDEQYISGTWEPVLAKSNGITLRIKYMEDGVYQRESQWTVRGKELNWHIGSVGATYERD